MLNRNASLAAKATACALAGYLAGVIAIQGAWAQTIGGAKTAKLPSSPDIQAVQQALKAEQARLDAVRKYVDSQIQQLTELQAALVKADAAAKNGIELTPELKTVLDKIAAALPVGSAVPKQITPVLRLHRAAFGDLRYGHVCDALPFLQDKCKLRTDEKEASAKKDYCLITAASMLTASSICGFDPSPQGIKHLVIEFSCDESGKARKTTRLRAGEHVRLVCRVPDEPAVIAAAPKNVDSAQKDNAGGAPGTTPANPAPGSKSNPPATTPQEQPAGGTKK